MSDETLAPGGFGPGSRLASYRLDEPVGRGGMATVYRAYDIRLQRRVALKILAPQLAGDEEFRQRFIRESRTAAAVDHPNIIPIFEAGEAGGMLFIAMRFVDGRDVQTIIDSQGPLPVARACDIVTQVASALDAAHASGLVHRDVKPANMLRDSAAGGGQADHVYLSDFGLSKRSLSSSGLTSKGHFLGTLNYVPPEQIEGRTVDGRSDQYALACSAFEMLSGTPPFKQDETLAIMWAQLSTAPPALTARRPGLPAAVDQVMARALAKSPVDRYPTCLEFAAALRRVFGPPAGAAERAGKGVSFTAEHQPNLPVVEADANRLQQVLRNLLSNALKFTPQGGDVRLTATYDHHQVRLSVADTGIGIAPEHLERIFERYYQVADASAHSRGQGLGLAIVRIIVEGHGGRIDVRSKPGRGSTFTVFLPIALADPNDV